MPTPRHSARQLLKERAPARDQAHRHADLPDGRVLYRQLSSLRDRFAAQLDPIGVAAPILHAQRAWLMHPQELSERMTYLTTDLWRLQ